jgi:hypothetical protein
MAYIWDLQTPEGDPGKGWCRGTLRQGYMMKKTEWDFPLTKYASTKDQRHDRLDKEFDEVKRIRNN